MKEPVSIHLDSEHVILRTIGDDEAEPATLSGSVVLDLSERTDVKDVVVSLVGRSRITYTEMSGSYKTHTLDHTLYYDDHSFLPSFDGSSSGASHSNALHNLRSSSSRPPSRQGSSTNLNDLGEHPTLGSSGASPAPTPSPHESLSRNPLESHGHHASESSLRSSKNSHHHHHHHHHHHNHHAHTFNKGLHTFPFSFTTPGSLPGSVRANNGSSVISYQLKVVVTKAGMFGSKWSVKRPFQVIRGLLPDAAEFNQTLEIDNTWPGKIMYNITLPHKAFCTGEKIPVALKFTPIAKGVKVTQLVTSIKENMTITAKNGQAHHTTRDICTKKHNFHPRSSLSYTPSGHTQGSAHPVSAPPSRRGSYTDLASMANQRLNLDDHPFMASGGGSATTNSRGRSGHHTPVDSHGPGSGIGTPSGSYTIGGPSLATPSGSSSANASRHGSRANSPERVYYGRTVTDPDFAGLVDEESGDVDVDAVVEIPIPASATVSHQYEPLHISHKIKWSAYIRNLDGHTSELRCALPIVLLSPVLSEEARLASSGTRSLLFGPSGVLVPAAEGIQQVDLPSYSDHVLDRVANFDTANIDAAVSGTGSSATNFVRSPWVSPMQSPAIQPSSHEPASINDLVGDPAQRGGINWADSELLASLSVSLPQQGNNPATSQSHSQHHSSHASSQTSSHHASPATSRPGSRPASRPSSRPHSRASSPVRGESTNNLPDEGLAMHHQASPGDAHPSTHRQGSGFFGKHFPKPFTHLSAPSSHSASHTSLNGLHGNDRTHSSGSLTNLFHHRPGNSRSHTQQSNLTLHETPSHSPPLSRDSFNLAAAHPEGSSTSDPLSQGLSAALEAHQAKEARSKGKGKGVFKGKKRAGVFASLHADDHDHDHDHDHEHEHDHHEEDHHHHHDTDDAANRPDASLDASGQRFLSQVPSYDIASRGFLGGGVPPLSLSMGLPSYDQSEIASRPTTPVAARSPAASFASPQH